MTPRWKKATYTTIAGLGLFAGTAGIAAAATGSSVPSAATPAAASPDAPGPGVTPAATQGSTGPGAQEGDEPGGEQADDQAAYTSSITVADTGSEHDDAAEAAALQQLATISADEASQAALAAVPGTVNTVELDNENGSVVYSVEVRTDAGLIDVKVDAGNGSVLAQESDHGEQKDGSEIEGASQDD